MTEVRRQLLAPFGVALLIWGCGARETLLETRARLAPSELGNAEALPLETLQFETLQLETRPVMRAPRRALVRDTFPLLAREGAPATLRIPLPDDLAGADRVLLAALARPPEQTRWLRSPPEVVRVERSPRGVELEFPAPLEPGAEAAKALEVNASLLALDPPGAPSQTPALSRAGGEIAIGFGVLHEARGLGPVAFSLEVCEAEVCEGVLEEHVDPSLVAQRGWHDRRVALAPWVDREIFLRLHARPVRSGLALGGGLALGVWSQPALLVPTPRSADAPSILLVSIDTLGAQHLSFHGYPRATAPHLEARLAAKGVVFERALTAASTTGPSHMTLFTSLLPSAHRLVDNAGTRPLSREIATLAEALGSHGLATAAVTEGGAIARGLGFERGFDVYAENLAIDPGRIHAGVARTLERGRGWLERNEGRRFFLFLHTYQVHSPYQPPPGYAERFAGDPAPASVLAPDLPPEWHPDHYDAGIAYTDESLHRFLEALRSEGLLDDVLVVVTADHGEAFLEHGYLAHGAGIHEEILRVPLLFSGPRVPAGRRVTAPVGLVDLMPTLLELAGAPAPEGLMGRSLASLVLGGAPDASWSERPLFSEAWRRDRAVVNASARVTSVAVRVPSLAVRVGSRKLIRLGTPRGFRYEYYDLASDPREERNLLPAHRTEADDLRKLLERYPSDMARRYARLAREEDGRESILDPERERALRALGYLR